LLIYAFTFCGRVETPSLLINKKGMIHLCTVTDETQQLKLWPVDKRKRYYDPHIKN
jgi:hypothetical protein